MSWKISKMITDLDISHLWKMGKMKYIYQTPFRYFLQLSSPRKNLGEQKYAKCDESHHSQANKGNMGAHIDQPVLR